MMLGVVKTILITALCSGLAACVPGTTTGTPPVSAPPVSTTDDAAYVSRKDGAFTLPAIDVAKVPPQFRRQSVAFATVEAPGTIIINPASRVLHLVTGKNKAIRYGIAVGRAGFEWSGVAVVSERKHWPTWTPPAEMIARKPELAKFEKGQPGGLTNPLGARALYLTSNGVDYGYRIHGTPEWQSIGSNASSGCIRMINQDVIDLFDRVPSGAKVIVLNADGSMPSSLKLPPPTPKIKKAAAAVVKVAKPVLPAVPTAPPLSTALIAPESVVTASVVTASPLPASPVPKSPLLVPTPIAVAPAPATAVTPVCTLPLVNGLCPPAKP